VSIITDTQYYTCFWDTENRGRRAFSDTPYFCEPGVTFLELRESIMGSVSTDVLKNDGLLKLNNPAAKLTKIDMSTAESKELSA